jgi:GntR family transcriptional regulator
VYLNIDQNSGTPVYIQITEQIKKAISIGVFEIGKPIPTIREIAIQLRINPNTVAKAIKELEREGILKTFVGKGSFVTENSLNITKKDQEGQALQLIEQFIKDVKWLNVDKDLVINMIQENWDKLSENK